MWYNNMNNVFLDVSLTNLTMSSTRRTSTRRSYASRNVSPDPLQPPSSVNVMDTEDPFSELGIDISDKQAYTRIDLGATIG